MDEELKKEIILQHYTNPINNKECNDHNYLKTNANSVSCIDNIDIYILFDNDIIKDIVFNGEACAISTSSTSILIKNIIGKTKKEAIDFINNFENMINEKEYNSEELNEAIVYDEIYKQGNRKTCAYLPYMAVKKVLLDKLKD